MTSHSLRESEVLALRFLGGFIQISLDPQRSIES